MELRETWEIALLIKSNELLTKTHGLAYILVLVRWSFPRFSEDQLQNIAWKILIPLSLLNIFVTSIMKVVF